MILRMRIYNVLSIFLSSIILQQEQQSAATALYEHTYDFEQFPNKYLKKNDHMFQSRIVGGSDASEGEFPFMAGLYLNYNWPPSCGGTLIASNLILTAAHCNSAYRLVRIGSIWAEESSSGGTRKGVDAKVIKRMRHPSYTGENGNLYDFVILELDRNIDTNLYPPIELNFNMNVPGNQDMTTAIGFGQLEYKGLRPDRLQKVNIPTTSYSKCRAQYGAKIQRKEHLCAGYPEGGKDSCIGDSGGPLLSNNNNNGKLIQVGVVSFGRGCALPNFSGVYARVSGATTWIQNTVCRKGNFNNDNGVPSYCENIVTTPQPSTLNPTPQPTQAPQQTSKPTSRSTSTPTSSPSTLNPTPQPTQTPQQTSKPTSRPTSTPTSSPSTLNPTPQPTQAPQRTSEPTSRPTSTPTSLPTLNSPATAIQSEEIDPLLNSSHSSNNNDCNVCDDAESSWMIEWNIDCTTSSEESLIQTCKNDEYWVTNKFCQQSCYDAGFGYDGDNCCAVTTTPPKKSSSSLAVQQTTTSSSQANTKMMTDAPPPHQEEEEVNTISTNNDDAPSTTDTNCNECSDKEVPWLEVEGIGCDKRSSDVFPKKCNMSKFWRKKNICQLTCYQKGYGYAGDICCNADKKIRVPQPLPMPSSPAPMPSSPDPTPMPSKQRHCIDCTDIGNPWMQDMNEACEDSDFIGRKCIQNETWRKNKYCQATCYKEGLGYEEDVCCTNK